ncbi:glutamine--tRNA ligase/YqeY domain fusion protein [Moraxella catarrhalis]|uniref:Glutamine--tRNA ligase n=1 Tax=Moraxella catarrhalis TaxID=480 RepID=A0AB36DL95_MORCA|nr:glutamine--tRNA ligase/YqeY domain fusion protein [Moraxella catarrhalis]MPX29530.1 glutamine--tRNA ligase/YqeY domain fusion protein [Moraxella catarrhalis]OAV22866.1 Glutaminyl-tRNA synthetase [Moraxella catarrhalis]RKL86387.1 glutamine--tRNA ligase/YqeY domain fusion protein [Moraxella catarrhalis]RKL87220.1 glutamine--tRNA ligase/YqeY domain fusion protein [Moraxella catarrhalis]RKL97327.1 glutamine--tRNA ligase/YqeY domain fusion protein [Moraxella catarrhalis]
MSTQPTEKNDFIRTIIRDDLASGKHDSILTRFPPEPNGYLHIGHVKSICLNFGVANEFGGACNLRFDDTNPTAEKQDFVDGIKEDVRWLGFEWAGDVRYASSYFDELYGWAVQLIKQGDAYVDLQSIDEIRANRGSFTEVGVPSPQRDASIEENLARFEDMRQGKFADGEAVLRAKIDMTHPNLNMRDPVIYRVMHAHHHQTGDKWCIYPMYDFAHPLSDAYEGITHSLCTLEFEDHRPFYDWVVQKVGFDVPPRQYEFSRLNIDHTLTSKRKLKRLVDMGVVSGWDDPRMPTVAGMRRRGYTPEGLRDFCERIGITKSEGLVDHRMLEFSVRKSLEETTARGMAVLRPLKVTITNFDDAVAKFNELKNEKTVAEFDGEILWLTQPKHPQLDMGERQIPFTKTIYIDATDYEIEPPAGYKRLSPNNPEIRLRNSYILKVNEHKTDDAGNVIELIATIDEHTLGNNPEGRKVKGVIHWVSATHGVAALVRLYDHLLLEEDEIDASLAQNVLGDNTDADAFWIDRHLNPNSLTVYQAVVEPDLAKAAAGERFQFERESYFIADSVEHTQSLPVFNQIVSLKDSFKPE